MTLEKFRLLCWKNFTLQKRHPIAGLCEIIFPIIIVLIFTFARSNLNPIPNPQITFAHFEPNDYESCRMHEGVERVGISPSNNLALEELVKSSVGLSLKVEFFKNAAELDSFLSIQNDTVVGIQFDDNIAVSHNIKLTLFHE